MKFRFYIIDLPEGYVKGTNSMRIAEEYSAIEDYFVVDAELGQWLTVSGDYCDVIEAFGFSAEGR
jgi:hypothetical protein